MEGQSGKEQILAYLSGSTLEEFFEFDPEVRSVQWKDVFLKTTLQLEYQSQKRNMAQFKLIFVDSWRKKNIQPLIKKLDLSFQLHVNNDVKYLVSSIVPKSKNTKLKMSPKIQFNQDSLSFDVVLENNKQVCPPLSEIFSLKFFAVLKSQNLLRNISEIDFKDALDKLFSPKHQQGPFLQLKMLNLAVVPLLGHSTIIMGYYNQDGVQGNRSRTGSSGAKSTLGSPPSFFTVNLLYIDLLKKVTKVDSILNEKYCDIDPEFGLHDYTVSVELRNQKQTFFGETFRKVFAKGEDIEYVTAGKV
jgi:hypothetical protein